MISTRLPTYYVSHGGGPWPWLKKEMPFFEILEQFLREIPHQLPQKPRAILVISGHWDEKRLAIQFNPNPPMIYDYYGFPEHTYQVQYPAPGAPELALQVQTLLADSGLHARLDSQRGYDHGTFVPLFAMYPKADVPVLQISMKSGYDPETHLRLGQALSPLRDQGVLILGSGASFHNLPVLMKDPRSAREESLQFDQWLQDTLVHSAVLERQQRLVHWTQAPFARFAHPSEDHLIPLFVALGAAESEKGSLVHHELMMNEVAVSSFRFG